MTNVSSYVANHIVDQLERLCISMCLHREYYYYIMMSLLFHIHLSIIWFPVAETLLADAVRRGDAACKFGTDGGHVSRSADETDFSRGRGVQLAPRSFPDNIRGWEWTFFLAFPLPAPSARSAGIAFRQTTAAVYLSVYIHGTPSRRPLKAKLRPTAVASTKCLCIAAV